jgi:ribose 5-phosphate isomerase B
MIKMANLRLAIDADDAAIELKNVIIKHLLENGWSIQDLNFSNDGNAYYPEIAANLARKIQTHEFDRGILICGTGLGMSITANKFFGVYAGLCHDVYSAERLAKSNNANVLTMGARVIGSELAKKIVDSWLGSSFEGGRSLPKIQQIQGIEKENFQKKCE